MLANGCKQSEGEGGGEGGRGRGRGTGEEGEDGGGGEGGTNLAVPSFLQSQLDLIADFRHFSSIWLGILLPVALRRARYEHIDTCYYKTYIIIVLIL